jgi:hypothetical protein
VFYLSKPRLSAVWTMKGFSRCTSCDNEPDELCDTCGRVRCNDCLSRCCERTCCEKAGITFTCGRCQKEICEDCARYCDVCDDVEDNLGCCDACLTCRTCPKCDALACGYCFPKDGDDACLLCTVVIKTKKDIAARKRSREEDAGDAYGVTGEE